MKYLLDANLLSYFLIAKKETALAAAAEHLELATATEVVDELRAWPALGARFTKWFATSGITEVSIVAFTDVASSFRALHADSAVLKDKGEHACIALAVHDPEIIFVANDRNALWKALREIHREGAQIIGVRVFLRRLHELAGLPAEAIDEVARAAQGPEPTWWAAWRARIEPKPA